MSQALGIGTEWDDSSLSRPVLKGSAGALAHAMAAPVSRVPTCFAETGRRCSQVVKHKPLNEPRFALYLTACAAVNFAYTAASARYLIIGG